MRSSAWSLGWGIALAGKPIDRNPKELGRPADKLLVLGDPGAHPRRLARLKEDVAPTGGPICTMNRGE